MRYKNILVILLILVSLPHLFGQSNYNGEISPATYLKFNDPDQKRHSMNIELLGAAGIGSINYERQFAANKNHRWMYRVGVGGSYIDKNNGAIFIFPLTTHFIVGKKSHYLDLSAGIAPSITTHFNAFVRAPLGIGYRFEHWYRRLYYRISYTPLVSFLLDVQYEHWFGATIGYHFKWR